MKLYEPYLEEENYTYVNPMEDYIHIDELKKYDDAKEHLEEIIHQLYNSGNIDSLEDALYELTNIFEIKLPIKKPILKGE